MTSILECRGLTKVYGKVIAVNNVSLGIGRGETKVIFGPSGSGKSTLLRCLGLLEKPTKGSIYFNGVDVYASKQDLNKLRARIGFVFQDPSLFRHLTALGNVMLGLKHVLGLSDAEARRKAYEALKLVKMEDWANYYPAQLSGGQQQRVGIARAISMDPEVVLFDEPTAALDVELKWEVIAVMRDLAERGTTMLVATHELRFAREVADEMIFMDQGQIIEAGSPDHFFTSPNTERARKFMAKILG
ncbi:MAG: amino acid ABC transporter ATP-binding protein [Thaumarchaeota archaeon]|jgi:ABC-type polar amino acid transport system ATPase subunit|nr:amino acid ABC transporter ATP-binding protein [Candidatus Geocrenenecus arthurdayi]MCL7388340.1 amino acid ABC transporter ATP-binding protein [Candidatus Geocrenenecus arthurdayi]MCL7390462.1 amino acid ABC transporter ATP-binding protein [Candidatus Geocrenenecus arthurdayi]MCL7396115.1 amino acid ABC transporter ATP-binding protein [Candidatus Geocrenenecus arthurdayi]MCL7401512.1 amino acid ABC transporter ATP-binding protein [Candidatus Geocrenenecus arthurdayi]